MLEEQLATEGFRGSEETEEEQEDGDACGLAAVVRLAVAAGSPQAALPLTFQPVCA